MSMFTVSLIVFGLLSVIATFVVIITAMFSSQITKDLEGQEKLRRLTHELSNTNIADLESSPVELLDMSMDANSA